MAAPLWLSPSLKTSWGSCKISYDMTTCPITIIPCGRLLGGGGAELAVLQANDTRISGDFVMPVIKEPLKFQANWWSRGSSSVGSWTRCTFSMTKSWDQLEFWEHSVAHLEFGSCRPTSIRIPVAWNNDNIRWLKAYFWNRYILQGTYNQLQAPQNVKSCIFLGHFVMHSLVFFALNMGNGWSTSLQVSEFATFVSWFGAPLL